VNKNSNNNHSALFKSGTKIGDYKITKIIGSDKTGETCMAVDTQLDKKVIIKLIPSKQSIKQASLAMKLSHPNIVSLNETGQYQNRDYLVMEYVNGKLLSEFIDEGSVSNDFAIDVAIQISNALAYAHSEDVYHGGLTSSNILIDTDGHPRLTDFGLNDGKKDSRADLFTLGVVQYEMLTGKKFSKTNTNPELLINDLQGLPEKYRNIIVKLLEKKNDNNYQDADDLLADLMNIPESKKLTGKKPVDWWNRFVVPIAFIIILIMAIYWLFYDNK